MKMKWTTTLIIAAGCIIAGAIFLTNGGSDASSSAGSADNVRIVDGEQIIEIQTRGGYRPKKSIAQAGMPTIVRFITSNTFDCSSYISISRLNISKALPQTGSTDIDIGTSTAGKLSGTCGMGMYGFEIEFR